MELCLSYEYPGFFHIGPIENTPWVWSTKSSSDFLEKWPTNYRAVPGSDKFVGDRVPSGDFSQFIFSSRELAFAIGGRESAPGSAYDNDIASKSVTVISKLPSGADIEQERPAPNEFIRVKAVSPNGSHVLLATTSLEGPENAYLRVNGAITYTIGTGVKVIGMSRNGDKVIVESNNELTPEDTDTSSDLYMWQESTQSLKLLSVSGSAGNTDDCNTTWTGKCGAVVPTTERKDTDSRLALQTGDVVFYSPESLDPTKPGVPNQRNVYLTHDGGIHLIATLDPGTTIDRLQISPNGEHVAFLTRASLTGYDNTSCEYEVPTESRGFEESHVCKPMEEMYEYDANRASLTCVSCMRDGTPPTNDVLASAGGLFMSDDGRTFFTTSDPLVPADTDRIFDVYEYVDGRPQLISAGNGVGDFFSGGLFYPPQRTGLEGVSHDGADVYFSTYDTLVPQDHNGHFVKFYDARENGGFPLDAGVLPCKAADECHGPGSEPSEEPQVSTDTGLGAAGNVVAKKQKKNGSGRRARHRRRHRHHRRAARHARGPRRG
jgi:hypothetical protein